MISEIAESISGVLFVAAGAFLYIQKAPALIRQLCWITISVLAAVAGGWFWEHLCKLSNWPFNLGGPHNEPYGGYAFVWGAITLLPVIALVRFFSSEIAPLSRWRVLHWLVSKEMGLVVAYSLTAGAAAVIFYGWRPAYGVRTAISSLGLPFEESEMLIILAWAFVVGCLPGVAVRLAGGKHSVKNIYVVCGVPALLAAAVCLPALLVYFNAIAYQTVDPQAKLRGLIAGAAFRFAVFWGLWLIVDERRMQSALDFSVAAIRSSLSDKQG